MLERGLARHWRRPEPEIDLSRLATVDSSAVATLLAWKRAAAARNASLALSNLPANLQSLVALYGVDELLQVVRKRSAHCILAMR